MKKQGTEGKCLTDQWQPRQMPTVMLDEKITILTRTILA
jgi:hypothetical protein